MTPEIRQAILTRLKTAVEAGDTLIEPQHAEVGVERYTDTLVFQREQQVLFRRRPIIAAHVSELANPGDYVMEWVAGLPVLVVRQKDGSLRGFLNVCRHRGAMLVDDRCGSRKALTCPYHAWTYRLDGTLQHVPRSETFSKLDVEAHTLEPVQVAERHGFVWVQLDGEPDVEAFLGPDMDRDMAHLGLVESRVETTTVRGLAANWKLVMDAFCEGYHVKALHRTSVSRFFTDTVLVDDFYPHVRNIGARKSLREVPPDANIFEHTTIFYNVFPNGILVFHPTWASFITVVPMAVDYMHFVHRMLVPAAPVSDEAAERRKKSFALIDKVVMEDEDLKIALNIQKGLRSGVNDRFVLGGLEKGMAIYHRAWDEAMAPPDL